MREVRDALPNLSFYLVGHEPSDTTLPADVAIDALKEASLVYGAQHVRFAGRGACNHPDLPLLIDAAIELGYTWQPCLDGTDVEALLVLLTETRRAGLLLPYVTLDSADESVHDAARGAGSYRSSLQTLATMAALDLPTEVRIELHRMNQAGFEQTCMLALKLGAERLVISLAMPASSPLDQLLALPRAALVELAARAKRIEEVLALDVVVDPSLRAEPPFQRCPALDARWMHFGPDASLALCDKHIGTGGPAPSSGTLRAGVVASHHELLAIGQKFYQSRLAQLHGSEQTLESPCTHCLRLFGCTHWTDDDSRPGSTPGSEPSWRNDWAGVGTSE